MVSPEIVIFKKTRKTKILKDTMKERHTRKVKPQKDIKKRGDSKEKETNMTILGKITEFKRNGITILETMDEPTLSDMVRETNEHYYNTQIPLLTDTEYDILKEYVERKYPENVAIKEVGAPIGKNKAELPYEMASMDKIKPDTDALVRWTAKYTGPYVLSCKLDGVSGLYIMGAKHNKLYTRGDGKVGQDISHLLGVFDLPKGVLDLPKGVLDLPNEKSTAITQFDEVAVRGELIMPKRVFDEKYKESFANPRNLVSGIVNRKTVDEKARDLRFVAYEVIHPPMKPSEQMGFLVNAGFEVVCNQMADSLSNPILSALLLQWRHEYEYEIDGVIVTNDRIYPRKPGNPEHAFAFKMVISDQQAEAKVVDVIWAASKDGYLKPRVRLEPIRLGGVTIEYATGFNGKFIEDNRIGIGAIVQLVRSGDVIPYITEVSFPAEHPKMPTVPYIWTDTMVDVVLQNPEEDAAVQEKMVAGFFSHLEVDGLAKGNVARLFAAGFTNVPVILKMTKTDFERVEGFKTKMIDKVYHSIHEKVGKASLLDIMVASNKMGRGLGERKIQPILTAYPNILTSRELSAEKEAALKHIKGIGKENAREFVEHIPGMLTFLEECGLSYKLNIFSTSLPVLENTMIAHEINRSSEHPLYHKKVVMTKIRDKKIIDALSKYGAILENSMTKDVFVVIVKSKTDTSNKTDYAKKYNIPIMTPDEFVATYL